MVSQRGLPVAHDSPRSVPTRLRRSVRADARPTCSPVSLRQQQQAAGLDFRAVFSHMVVVVPRHPYGETDPSLGLANVTSSSEAIGAPLVKRIGLFVGLPIVAACVMYAALQALPNEKSSSRVTAGGPPVGPQRTVEGPDVGSSPVIPIAVSSGPLLGARQYPEAGVRLDVPPPNLTPTVPASAALALCKTTAPCLTTSAPTLELALFSDDQYGGQAAESVGSVQTPARDLPFQNRLAWIMTWRHVSCEVHGPPGLPPPPPSFATGCDQVDFVDASSGTYLVGIEAKSAF